MGALYARLQESVRIAHLDGIVLTISFVAACSCPVTWENHVLTSTPGAAFLASPAIREDRVGIAWEDYRDGNHPAIYFAEYTLTGQPVTAEAPLFSTPGQVAIQPVIEAVADGYVAAWSAYPVGGSDSTIYAIKIDASGEPASPPSIVADHLHGSISGMSIASNGSGLALVWSGPASDRSTIFFTLLSAEAERIGEIIPLTDAPNSKYEPAIESNGTGYGVAWRDLRDRPVGSNQTQVYFVLLDSNGSHLSLETRLSDLTDTSGAPQLVWSGTSFGVTWGDYTANGEREVFLRGVDGSGTPFANIVLVSGDVPSSAAMVSPAIGWFDSRFALVWENAPNNLFFRMVQEDGTLVPGYECVGNLFAGDTVPRVAATDDTMTAVWYGRPTDRQGSFVEMAMRPSASSLCSHAAHG